VFVVFFSSNAKEFHQITNQTLKEKASKKFLTFGDDTNGAFSDSGIFSNNSNIVKF
jgi:hypothetical protein